MAKAVAETGAGVVLMHTRGRPDRMQADTSYTDLMGEVSESLAASLALAEAAGVEPERIVLDPGIGFGKNVEGNLELIRRLGELKKFGRPILVGPSRKSFIRSVLGREGDRVYGTAAAVAVSLLNGASIFRVHDVAAMRDVVDMTQALAG
jgi:dihydropteroate synthase